MNKTLLTKFISISLLIIAFIVFILTWRIFKNPLGEYVVYFLIGSVVGLFKIKKFRIFFTVFVIIAVTIAIFFDPVMKTTLDSLFNVNTVGIFKYSIILNLLSLLSYIIGYKFTRTIIIKKEVLKEI